MHKEYDIYIKSLSLHSTGSERSALFFLRYLARSDFLEAFSIADFDFKPPRNILQMWIFVILHLGCSAPSVIIFLSLW